MTSHPQKHSLRAPRSARRGQRGFGILQASLLVVLVGAAVVAGLTLLKSGTPAKQATQQEEALRWADDALVAFAAANARLPCPVVSPTSLSTDCVAAGQKGWLPTQALEAVHPGGAGPAQPLRYMVYQGGTGSDLSVASNAFSPHTWERTQHDLAPINGLDLCAKLASAARETTAALQPDRARTQNLSGITINVAYGLVAAGPTPGAAGGRFDGVNQSDEAVLEAPSRGADSSYDDRSRVRDFNSLAQTLGCGYASPVNPDGLTLAALDMLALAVDVSDEVAEQHQSNKDDTTLSVGMAAVSEVFAILNVALSGASISNSVSTLATASAQLSAAVASCAVLVGCGFIPPYTAAVTAAGVAIGLASTATGLAAGALVATTVALGLTIEARDMADKDLGSAGADLTEITEQTCIGAEGGFVSQIADENGVLITVDPPQWRDGLQQEVALTMAELTDLEIEAEANRVRLARLEQIPSVDLIVYPPEPVRSDGESDEAWNTRYQSWLDVQRDYETLLQAKLGAIRVAKQAQFDWDTSVQAAVNAEKELNAMLDAVNQLAVAVTACNLVPPGDLVGTQRCENQRRSLRGFATCDADILTSAQVLGRQCLPWKQADHQDAITARDAARGVYLNAEWAAVSMPQPPIKPYISDTGWYTGVWSCTVLNWCDPLIVWQQDDDDKRETYAKTVYKSLGLQVALREKQADLDEKRRAFTTAQAQCEILRNLEAGGSAGGTELPPVWAGADAIMRAANCKGATGAVQPATCGATP